MSLKVLIVEDNEEILSYFMRIFKHKLDLTQFEFVCASTIQAALDVLPDQWDVILMDYAMGEAAQIDQMTFRNGADLVSYRRALEAMAAEPCADQSCYPCLIVGTSSNTVSNVLINEAGANHSYLKLDIPEIADYLQSRLQETCRT